MSRVKEFKDFRALWRWYECSGILTEWIKVSKESVQIILSEMSQLFKVFDFSPMCVFKCILCESRVSVKRVCANSFAIVQSDHKRIIGDTESFVKSRIDKGNYTILLCWQKLCFWQICVISKALKNWPSCHMIAASAIRVADTQHIFISCNSTFLEWFQNFLRGVTRSLALWPLKSSI